MRLIVRQALLLSFSAAVAAAVVLAAAPAARAFAGLDPCALLTAADAEKIAGGPVRRIPITDLTAHSTCKYEQDAGKPPVKVSLVVSPAKPMGKADIGWDAMKSGIPKDHSEKVAALGDEAYLVHGIDLRGKDLLSNTLFVRKGTAHFVLQAAGYKHEPLDVLESIAKRIAGQL